MKKQPLTKHDKAMVANSKKNNRKLTFEEKIVAAYLFHVSGWEQIDIAVALHGVNPGRVSEACTKIGKALK